MTPARPDHAGATVHALPQPLRIDLRVAARLPKRIVSESEHVHEARCKAVAALGRKWIAHPGYTFNPRHSNDPEVYGPARQPYLDDVARRAAADRSRNPAYLRACAVRRALESFA